MKKILFLLLAVTLSGGLSAEEMQFVTTLSQPTGSFARVESVNADSPARALQVNFCNSRISSGVVSVSGAVRAAYLKLDNSGSLGGNVPVYQLSTLNLGSGRSFEGGNVWAQEADPAAVKADGTLYGTDMKYLVAELPALEITDTANIKRGGPTGEDLEWGAQYDCDYKAGGTSGFDVLESWTPLPSGQVFKDTCDGRLTSWPPFEGPVDGTCVDLQFSIMPPDAEFACPPNEALVGESNYCTGFDGVLRQMNVQQVSSSACTTTLGTGTSCHCSNLPVSFSRDVSNRVIKFGGSVGEQTVKTGAQYDFWVLGRNAVNALAGTMSKFDANQPFISKSSKVADGYVALQCIFDSNGKWYTAFYGMKINKRVLKGKDGSVECKDNKKYDSYILKSK